MTMAFDSVVALMKSNFEFPDFKSTGPEIPVISKTGLIIERVGGNAIRPALAVNR